MKSKTKILALIENNRDKIKSFGVKEIGVFGSVVRDEATEKSDIDILVDFEKKTFDSYMGLLFFLEDLLETKVDLVMKTAIKPIIRDNILSETIYVQNL